MDFHVDMQQCFSRHQNGWQKISCYTNLLSKRLERKRWSVKIFGQNWIFSRAFNIIPIFMCCTGSKLNKCCRWNAWNSYEVCNSAHSQWFLVCAVARRNLAKWVICMASLGCESRRPGYPSHPLGAAGSPSIPGTVSSQHSPSGRVEGSHSSVRSRCFSTLTCQRRHRFQFQHCCIGRWSVFLKRSKFRV